MQSPTGKKVRNDKAGFGHFLAPRGGRPHCGKDYECEPGQKVVAPCDGILVRSLYVYNGITEWKGLEIGTGMRGFRVKLFYVEVLEHKIGTRVKEGEHIGYAQDITEKYPNQGMTPHVHMEIILNDAMLYQKDEKRLYINPDTIGVVV